ncbi:hypothetical protein ACN4FU_01095 [Aliarcobacter butzleri]|uniref:hypothetical protein n=1 Tax=Aliarcobacter butzleri TaxID=28197 RepID=UPI001EDBE649|nr:hypothetical protein [Aliarcobacter butzleri]MCG3710931.1 hypothetical protein [Aliarcobacter butzleri]MCG3714282.1 hypothetical protein [Aliarcobacter butzleri]
MIENKIKNWIDASNENKAYPIIILKVNDEDIESIFNSIKKLNNKIRYFFVNKIDLIYEQFQFSGINQILIVKKNPYIFINEIQEQIKRGCLYIEDNDSINNFIYSLESNNIDLCKDIKYESIEKIDFLTILQDKTNLIKIFFDKVDMFENIGIHILDKEIGFYKIVLTHYVKYNIISANLIHKLYQIANLDFLSSSRAIGDKISLICGVKSKATHISNISMSLRRYVKSNIKVYDLNFNQIVYDAKLNIASKLIILDSKDLTVETISKITELPFCEIEKLYKQKYIR